MVFRGMKIFYFALLLGFMIFSTTGLSAREYDDNDIKRVLYLNKKSQQTPQRFVILESIQPSGLLECRILGSSTVIKLRKNDVTALDFYEDSSNFLITQYALMGMVDRIRKNLPLMLARVNNDNTGRINALANYANSIKEFNSNCYKILNQFASGSQEQEDALNNLLQKTKILDQIKKAAVSGDWALAIAMYDVYNDSCIKILNKHFSVLKAPRKEAETKCEECEKELVLNFARKLQQPNVRRSTFLKLYPAARGLWSLSAPGNYQELRNLFIQSMQSYVRSDKISKLFEPQDWGAAILDALLLVEGAPCAAELEKEFDTEMLNLSKRAAQK